MQHARRLAMTLVLVWTVSGGTALAQGVVDLLTMSPTWEAFYNAADLDGLAGLYTEDAVVMPPDMPEAVGSPVLRAIAEAYLAAGLVRSEVPAVTSYGVLGDEAWGTGPYRFFDADGNLIAEGKYVVVYRFGDGVWKIARHIWNNDAPLPAPGG